LKIYDFFCLTDDLTGQKGREKKERGKTGKKIRRIHQLAFLYWRMAAGRRGRKERREGALKKDISAPSIPPAREFNEVKKKGGGEGTDFEDVFPNTFS